MLSLLNPSIPYFNQHNGWFFIALVHRLSTQDDNTWTFRPQIKSPTTVRIRFFNARRYALERSDEHFTYYRPLLETVTIHSSSADKSVTIKGGEHFEYQYEQLRALNLPFDTLILGIIDFLTGHKPVAQFNLDLNSHQQAAVDDFCRMFPAIGQCIVQPATVILRLR